MYFKLVFLIAVAVLTAALLLSLRQQRVETGHALTGLQHRIHRTQREIWDRKARLSELQTPQELQDAIQRAAVDVQPLPNVPARDAEGPAVVWSPRGGR